MTPVGSTSRPARFALASPCATQAPRAGVAVPQVYVRDLVASVVRPVKELKAFGRVELAAGASARVAVHIPTDMLVLHRHRTVDESSEPGRFELQVGASSADIRLRGPSR